jgi:ferric enterobactin receptor
MIMNGLPTRPILLIWLLLLYACVSAQTPRLFLGKVISEAGHPLSFASIKLQPDDITYYAATDGSFSIPIARSAQEFTIVVTHVGMETITRNFTETVIGKLQVFRMQALSLKLKEVEVNGVRRKTTASNSSIVFDREAIEQTQALSVANVLNYLPGQTIIKPTVTAQTVSALILRAAVPMNSEQALNQAFGISIQVDGSVLSNDANMQTLNPGRMGFFSGNQIQRPDGSGYVRDRSYRNGTMYSNYSGDVANSGLDLRQIPAENIESIEVVSGVASARYGDYTNGVVIINRQAGITPLRINARTNEGTLNLGINKGMRLSPSLGVINVSFDYLNSNDDPRNKLKGYQRIGGGLVWTYQQKKAIHFKNTLSLDINTTLDRSKRDPDEGEERMVKFSSRSIRISDRGEWLIKKPWLYTISFQGSYSYGRQESYQQRYYNGTSVIGISDALVTGINEGHFEPGYYLSIQQIIGKPVTASARLETNSIFKGESLTYRLTTGVNYNYSSNKGPGLVIDPSRPFKGTGDFSDRPRPFNQVPAQSNAGVYIENTFTTRLLGRAFNANIGARGDIQNGYFSVSPRINSSWKISHLFSVNMAYGIATKAPSLSQVSPGDVYVDVPLVNAYNGYAAQSVYLVHTQVMQANNAHLTPYSSYTFEGGVSLDTKPVKISAIYFNRLNKDGFATLRQLMPVTLPNYTVTPQTGQKPLYAPNGTYKTYFLTYNKIVNANYNRTNGVELMIATSKIKAIQTSFSASTAYYNSYTVNAAEEPYYATDDAGNPIIDSVHIAAIGIYDHQASRSTNIKSTIVSTTHIPALRMAITFSGEIFWVNKTESLFKDIYPSGYLDLQGNYFPLTKEEAQSPDYAHLLKKPVFEAITTAPAFVYTNVSMRVSKEIGDALRFSFNAYNVFNIRPQETTRSGISYYNGQPAFGAELIFTIK